MASTRTAMRAIQTAKADPELVAALLSSRSSSEAMLAFSLLRYSLSERDLVQLINLREIIRLLPSGPFRTGEGLEILEKAARYEFTGRSYRRAFESAKGAFGIEFLGTGHFCKGVVIHTPTGRRALAATEQTAVDEALLPLLVEHRILLDAILEALELLGSPMVPTIYVTADDFIAEHGAESMGETFGGLF